MITYKSRIKNIIFEFSPAGGRARGVVIVCDGLPGSPLKKELLSKINDLGFFAIAPRYQGTWESYGNFLRRSPAEDIMEIAKLIKKRKFTEFYAGREFDCRKLKIYVLGGSFGGTVALSLSGCKDIDRIVAFSPIVDFKNHNKEGKEQDLLWLGGFLRQAFGRAYVFNDSDWKKMASGKLFNPPQKMKPEESGKVLIFYDRSDTAIDCKKIRQYCLDNKIKHYESEKTGHISFSKITLKRWKMIYRWLLK